MQVFSNSKLWEITFLLYTFTLGKSVPKLPHILFVIVDDFGWAEVGYHREIATKEVQTPTIDNLVKEGIELNRHYVHMMCTPSRASFQSGRLPVHVLTQLAGPCDKNGAIPRNITGIAAKLKKAGYITHQVGKWDCGMATPHHTPQGRGYDTSLTYFSHGNWMWTEAEWRGSYNNRHDIPNPGIIDFWDTDRPAIHLNGTGYEEYIFRDRILDILHNHDASKPLFLQYDSKVAHYPLQAPQMYQEKFNFIDQDNRRTYHAMVNFLDDQLLNITETMKQLGLWENTLMVLSSDNGGFVKAERGPCNTTNYDPHAPNRDSGHGTACFNGEAGANNYPLRGGKYSNFEGGIRVNAFVSGGFLPSKVRGTKLDEMIHIADWYGTLCGLADVDPTDTWAKESGLPPVDSFNIWPLLSGQNMTSPRTTILVHKNMLISGNWKYVNGGVNMIEAAWGGVHYPNASTASDPIDAHSFKCPSQGCLFNLAEDITEQHECSSEHSDLIPQLKAELEKQVKTIWSTSHKSDPECRKTAFSKYGGFFGPWMEI